MITIKSHFQYSPYPTGILGDFFAPEAFEVLANEYPGKELFKKMDALGEKYSLSEVNNPRAYHKFLASSPAWKSVHKEIKSDGFIASVFEELSRHKVDLKVDDHLPLKFSGIAGILRQLRSGRMPRYITTRFEFSLMPSLGGSILPHTDSTTKLVTIVVFLNKNTEWNEAYGGDFAICRPRDESNSFNLGNTYVDFEDVDQVARIPLIPNTGSLFIKTYDSWHCVFPMKGKEGLDRKTITINLELA